jgi:hypothetical protein
MQFTDPDLRPGAPVRLFRARRVDFEKDSTSFLGFLCIEKGIIRLMVHPALEFSVGGFSDSWAGWDRFEPMIPRVGEALWRTTLSLSPKKIIYFKYCIMNSYTVKQFVINQITTIINIRKRYNN